MHVECILLKVYFEVTVIPNHLILTSEKHNKKAFKPAEVVSRKLVALNVASMCCKCYIFFIVLYLFAFTVYCPLGLKKYMFRIRFPDRHPQNTPRSFYLDFQISTEKEMFITPQHCRTECFIWTHLWCVNTSWNVSLANAQPDQ